MRRAFPIERETEQCNQREFWISRLHSDELE